MTCSKKFVVCTLLLFLFSITAQSQNSTALEQLEFWSAAAGKQSDRVAGQKLFNTQVGKLSCASCHNAMPTSTGKHVSTQKIIEPLAPAFNPKRFIDRKKSDKWFSRNCKDVFARECSAAEKADVLAYLISLKP